MKDWILTRRDLLRGTILSAALSFSASGNTANRAVLTSPLGVLPGNILKSLPSRWRFKLLEVYSAKDINELIVDKDIDLLALGDGWVKELAFKDFQRIEVNHLRRRLNQEAIIFSQSFGSELSAKIFPIGFTPWAMLFRNGDYLLDKAQETWDVLLESDLKGSLVLPNSPRLVMTIADRISYNEGLKRLRQQVKTYDDKNALNWVLSGRAKAVVLPLQYCMTALLSDPRLSVAIPREGAPLNWTFLTMPKASNEDFPDSWVRKMWSLPLLGKLISRGWIPPLSYSEISKGTSSFPKLPALSFLSTEEHFQRLWSIPPVSKKNIQALQERWYESAP
ncbi:MULTISPECIES: ABC transporter substrate-binding protein [Prochlorococcus]|uniref:ABC transporter substrate-binding protein n=1 Tax=Prochlorococcus TaxID=1218 RepID=UPI0005338058|nr:MULTISPECIES: ABC transporter substrate-binding protein [Prochlorococcus]KGG12956.1 Periplasmic binding protein-like II [Prochlorococcus sp. MIT 0601]